MKTFSLNITQYRKKWYITAGKSRLSTGFASQELAQEELDKKQSLYSYWAGSAGVSVQNTTPIVKHV